MGRTVAAWTLVCALFALLVLPERQAWAQPSPLPSSQEVKELKDKYQAERQSLLQEGAAKKFPLLMDKAEEMAQRGDKALSEGRLRQARESFLKARWQLPNPSPQVPTEKHVAWMSSNLRPGLRHAGEVHAIAYSPDGRFLASGSNDRTVKIWDMGNGRELLTYAGHTDLVRTLAFSPDGKTIASAQSGPSGKGVEPPIRLWEVATGKDIRTFPGKGLGANSLVFNRDGKFLIVAHHALQVAEFNHALSVFETASGKLHHLVEDFRTPVTSVAFNDKGTILAAGVGFAGGPGEVRLWEFARMIDPLSDRAYWTLQFPSPIQQVLIGRDDRTLVCMGIADVRIFVLPRSDDKERVGVPTRVILLQGFARHQSIALSRDSKILYAGCTDGLIRLYDVETGKQVGAFSGHSGAVNALAVSPSGDQLASASSDRTIRVWDLNGAEGARDFPGHEGTVWKASFSPDGQRLVSASADHTVKVWDVAKGTVLQNLTGHRASVTSALFSPDGKFIASAGGDRVVKLWDAGSGKHLRDLEGHTGAITSLTMTGEKKTLLASAGVDRSIKIWDPLTGKELLTIADNGSIAAAIAFSPDGNQLAAGNIDQTIKLFDVANVGLANGAKTGILRATWNAHTSAVSGLAYSPDGQLLASCGVDKLVRLWPLATPGSIGITLSGHSGAVSSVAFHSDGRHLASCGSDREVKVWKIDPLTAVPGPGGDKKWVGVGKVVQSYRGHNDWVTSVAFSKNGMYLASSGLGRALKVWEFSLPENPVLPEPSGAVQIVAVSPDGKYVASGGADRTVRIWDRAKGVELFAMTGHPGAVAALAFTPDSNFLFSSCEVPLLPFPAGNERNPHGGPDRSTKRWNPATGQEAPLKFQLPAGIPMTTPRQLFITPDGKKLILWTQYSGGYTDAVGYDPSDGRYFYRLGDVYRPTHSVAFSANGKFISTCGKDCSIRVFELNSIPVFEHLWHIFEKEQAGAIALTPDGSQVICANAKGAVRIGKVVGKEVLHTFQAHDTAIHRCLVSPDGKLLATVGQDNIIKLWDLATRTELRRWNMGGGNLVASLAFTPDSKQLVGGSSNGTVYVLDLP